MRNAFVSLLAIIFLSTLLIGVYLSPNDLTRCNARPSPKAGCEKADAIVALSGGNTSVRANEAIWLYQNGWAPLIVMSGAAKDTTGPSNAAVMKQQAVEAGVPENAIVIEQGGRTTKENAANTKELLDSNNISRLILVTSAYHQRRASLEFRSFAGEGITILNRPAPKDPDWPLLWWVTPRGWWLAGGELAKIIAFYSGQSQ